MDAATKQQEDWLRAFYNLARLRQLHRQIARVSAAPQPTMELLAAPQQPSHDGPMLLLPGAFNPLTVAHLALAEAALQSSQSHKLYCVVSTQTINKEHTERASLLDRLLLLDLLTERLNAIGALLTNRGLYVEQAEAAQALFGATSPLFFVIGYDKIEQILDPRYYTNRDATLRRLFALAHLLVAPRASHEASDTAAIMQLPENQAFQPFISILPLPVSVRDIASSQIRAAFQQKPSAATLSLLLAWLPPEIASFCVESGCYASPITLPDGQALDRYSVRSALIERALALPESDQQHIDLRQLYQLAISSTPEGVALRSWLYSPHSASTSAKLLTFQHRYPAMPNQKEPSDLNP